MKILALDCATAACSAAAWLDGAIVAAERAEMTRGHAEAMLPMVERVCRSAGLQPDQFDRFAVTVGPGHFTSLRVGLAAARGLALASGRPLIGITTLEAVAAAIPPARRIGSTVVVALDSKRAEPYVQSFDSALVPLDRPAAHAVAAYAERIVKCSARTTGAGDAAERLAEEVRRLGGSMEVLSDLRHPDAAVVAFLAAAAPIPAGVPGPLYIHPVQTTTASKAALSVSS